MRSTRAFRLLAIATCLAFTAQAQSPASKRVIYYYQTQYSNGVYVSLAPIWKQTDPKTGKPYTTDVMIAAFHLGNNPDGSPYIHLNDNVPQDPMFNTMWQEVAILQSHGITVRMMLGGAAQGSYADLFNHWSTFYPILKKTIQQYKLDGIDMDVEENVTLAHARKLIDQLYTDFGNKFLQTMSPVASALWGGANLSGFSYQALNKSPDGSKIAWYNGQFYSGFATLASPNDYEHAVTSGFPAEKIVGGMIGNPADGSGYVQISLVAKTIKTLVAKYPAFGGAASWEYFNTLPGGPANPVQWAAVVGKAMGN